MHAYIHLNLRLIIAALFFEVHKHKFNSFYNAEPQIVTAALQGNSSYNLERLEAFCVSAEGTN